VVEEVGSTVKQSWHSFYHSDLGTKRREDRRRCDVIAMEIEIDRERERDRTTPPRLTLYIPSFFSFSRQLTYDNVKYFEQRGCQWKKVVVPKASRSTTERIERVDGWMDGWIYE
jgi:hypothetical protein